MQRRHLLIGAALAGSGLGMVGNALANNDAAQLARSFAKTLSEHDIDAFARLLSETYINHQWSAASPPPTSGLSAKQATVALFGQRLDGIPDLSVTIETLVVDADKVAASFIYQGTHKGTLMGVAATGKHLRFGSCDIFRVENGLIAEHWGMGDIAGLKAQLVV